MKIMELSKGFLKKEASQVALESEA